MTTYYVSSEATNGYAVGNDTNDGLSKAAPWLTMDNVAALTTGTHDIYLNGAEIDVDAEFIVQTSLNIAGDVDKTQLNLRNVTSGQYGFRGGTSDNVQFTNVKLKAVNCTVAILYFQPTAAKTSYTCTNVEFIGNVPACVANADALIDFTITNCILTQSGTLSNGLDLRNLGATSEVAIDGLKISVSGTCNAGYAAVNCEANAANVSIDCSNVYGTITSDLATANFNYGVLISDCDTALIEDCDITINANNGGSNSACLYKITSAAVTPMVSCIIRNNRGFCNCPAGLMICAGEDGTANEADGILVYGNTVRGPSNVATLHGIMIGGNENCEAYNNSIKYVQIGLIAKTATGAIFAHNFIEWVTPTGTGHAMRMKGATDCMFVGNLHVISGAWNAISILITDNSGLPNSTGGIVAGNGVYAYPGATAQSAIVYLSASQTATFYANNYYPADGFSGSQFNDEGTTRTLTAWTGESHVFGDVSFRFAPRLRSKTNHRLLTLTQDVF